MKNVVSGVPLEIDRQIAINALHAMNINIDTLTKEQKNYMNDWNL